MADLTKEDLDKLFFFNQNGNFIRLTTTGGQKIGDVVGTLNASDGYIYTQINKKKYPIHHLVWLYYYKALPKNQIDHINHDRTDNRIENLRQVNNQENHKNMSLKSNNTSGFNGVYWNKSKRKWISRIKVNGTYIFLGQFISKEKAILKRQIANILFEFHENHGEQRL